MANFLSNVGAILTGQQEYQNWQTQQEQAKLRIEAEKENLAQIKEAAEEAKAQRKRQPQVAQGYLDFLSQGIPPPPQNVQAPAPGQASVPMIQPQPPVQYGQRPIGPDMGPPPQGMPPMPPGGVPPMPQGGPPQGQQGPQMPPQGPQGGPQGQPPIPPYQTVQGPPQPPQQAPQGIPPPPQQVQQAPRPNSMTLEDAAQFIKARGISDPVTSVQILDRLSPYLDNQAKQQANQLKLQLEFTQKQAELNERISNNKRISEDKNASIEERRAAAQDSNQTRLMLGQLTASIAQQNANTRSAALKDKVASGGTLGKEDYDLLADQVISGDRSVFVGLGRSPKDVAGVRAAITRKAKEQGLTGSDLSAATAGFEGVKAGERTLGTRTANIGLAGNEAALFAKNAVEASDKVNRTEYPTLNKALESWRKGTGNTEVVDLASYTNSLINAYARAVSPSGSPTVSDKEHAREILSTGFSKGQYQSAVNVILKEIEAAKQSPGQTKQELRELFKSGAGGERPQASSAPLVFSNAAELQSAIKSGKIKKGQTFNDPNGNPHTVN